MKKLAIAGLGLLILLAAVAPWVTGIVVASSWEDFNREFNESGGGLAVLETVEYDRGYQGTDVLSRLTLAVPEIEEPVEIYLRSAIAHGLLGARMETRLDPQRHEAWLGRFGDQPPLLVAQVGVSGNINGSLVVPGIAEDLEQGGRLRSHPVNMEFALTDSRNRARVVFDWQGFEISEGESQLRVGEILLEEDLSQLLDELWVGDISLSVSEVSSQFPNGDALVLEGITLIGGTHETGGDRLKNQMDFAVQNITVDEAPFGDLRMGFIAENFDVEATNAALVAANRLGEADSEGGNGSKGPAEQLRLFGEFMSALRDLMAQGLNLGIPSLVVNTPDGTLEMDFSFVHPQLEDGQREHMMSLFQHSEGGLNLKLPSALMAKAPADFQQQLLQLYQQGLIQEENGELLLNIELHQMTLYVNGHAIQIPPLI